MYFGVVATLMSNSLTLGDMLADSTDGRVDLELMYCFAIEDLISGSKS